MADLAAVYVLRRVLTIIVIKPEEEQICCLQSSKP